MDVIDAIYGRRAIRDFTPEPISRDRINRLIDVAVQAPSAMNRQPWRFIAVPTRSLLDVLSWEAKLHLSRSLMPDPAVMEYRERLEDPAFNLFNNAPALIVVCATSTEAQAPEDCALAAQNFMLAAHADCLGTCWFGFARPWLNEQAGKHALELPDHHVPVAPTILGRPAASVAPHQRRSPYFQWIGC